MTETKAATVSDASPQSAQWTRFLPEWGGIRENVQNSPFRWCVRESFLWGIATGTAMGFHRLRMKSHPFFSINVAFATSLLVTAPSYYFCYKRREHKEATIEMMMRANDFQNVEEMPEPVPQEEHPFLNVNDQDGGIKNKEFVANLKEKKEWQKQLPMKDADEVFQEKK
mmetsp:Transcript_12796/g.24016  ORF Transcript_12796/g.24016 Transcript_12796/m.24016 type:complete len:169 (-) Transcript_12796:274-780(-)|eukprot:CAMPEP_0176494338 /NCGR_PEP_ID=MMETSP0200_2-20121128/10038_1 /TAXON_ID=947934 /ORGANISM="Chaetoceros sp., Strain GSL56" /LENGTH=168 /DNA_ID=CAMNT_0017892079 /DNA_START=37 /DNA_END=543 /DNA_ORIENTATION=-